MEAQSVFRRSGKSKDIQILEELWRCLTPGDRGKSINSRSSLHRLLETHLKYIGPFVRREEKGGRNLPVFVLARADGKGKEEEVRGGVQE